MVPFVHLHFTSIHPIFLTSVAAGFAVFHVVVFLFFLLVRAVLFAVWATPFSLRSLVQFGVQANQVVRSWASVAKDDLPALLTNLDSREGMAEGDNELGFMI